MTRGRGAGRPSGAAAATWNARGASTASGLVPLPAPAGRWDPLLAQAASARRLLAEIQDLVIDADLEEDW